MGKCSAYGRGPGGKSKIEYKLDLSMLKFKNQVTLFVNYSYNSFYDFRFSENTYRKQKVI